ncbi:MAG: transporter substrate-binding domain-containing protein [Tunicatimonas sp.]
MNNLSRFVSLFSLAIVFVFGRAVAQSDTTLVSSDSTLTVGVAVMPPFVIKDQDKLWDGISVQLWRQMSDELNINYEFREVPQDSLVAMVARGALDVALLGTVTAEDEQRVDFSHDYFQTTLGVAGSTTQSMGSILEGLFTQRFFNIVLGLSILLLIVGTAIWLLERRSNEDNFGGERNPWQGIGSGFWWAGVTMTTIGYGDKAPITFWGRAVALLWMLIAMAVTASLTASLVSAVGLGSGGSINVPNELRSMKVGSIDGTDAAEYLGEERIKFQSYDSVPGGLQAVQQGDLEAFAHSTPVLRYWVNEDSNLSVKVEATDVRPQRYALVLPADSPLREPLNRALLKTVNGSGWQSVLERYVPKE